MPLQLSFVFLARVSVSLFFPGWSALWCLCGPCWGSWLQSYQDPQHGPQTRPTNHKLMSSHAVVASP